MKSFLKAIIDDPSQHVLWLNTLSYLENCGARKIASCEHPTKVKEEMLKHAAEEFRHALFFKKQIGKISPQIPPDYHPSTLFGSFSALHYLNRLDCEISRLIRGIPSFKEASYLLVTYAIEIRAEELYSTYEALLRENESPIFIKSILLEEKEHLAEITLEMTPLMKTFIPSILEIEEALWHKIYQITW